MRIDPATFRFPDPPKGSIEKGSLLFTHQKRHLGYQRLQPRSAGFVIRNWDLKEDLKARRLNRQICDVVKSTPNATLDNKRPLEHPTHFIKTVFSSRSKRNALKEDKKMPVVTHRTSEGREYGQILSGQIYDDSGNASTYQINESRRPLAPPPGDGEGKYLTTAFDHVGDFASHDHQGNGIKEPVNERSAHSSLENGKAKHRFLPRKSVEISTYNTRFLENGLLTDRQVNGNTAAGRKEETLEPSPRNSTTDDSLGLLRDLSQILSGSDLTAGASQTSVPEAEHQPRVRDFAANNGSAAVSRARAAIRRRSHSQIKKSIKQTEAPVTPDRSLDAACGGQPANQLGRSPNSIILPPVAFKEPGRPCRAPPLPMNTEQVPGAKTSPVNNYHSKAPSVVSAGSNADDFQSDASSGITSNAQSAVFVSIPPQPGPAPLTPLPSLPEGLPATPRASMSSRKLISPEGSPSKVPPQKSPARSQYKLYPSVDTSPPKRPGSPIRMNAAIEPEQMSTQPSPPLRSNRRGFSFMRSDRLPTSMSIGTLDELEHLKKERAENTKQKKIRDLARVKSHKAMVVEIEPSTQNRVNGERPHEGVVELSKSMDSYGSAFFSLEHKPQAS